MFMGKNSRFHRPDSDYIEYSKRSLESAVSEGKLTRDDARLIREFISEAAATTHISPARRYKIIYTLVGCRRFIGPFADAGVSDLYDAMTTLSSATKEDGSPYKQNTICDYVRFLKRFYLWLIENEYGSVTKVL